MYLTVTVTAFSGFSLSGSSFSSGQAWSGHPFMIRNVDAIPESTGVNARETF